ncbi:MULTISPECIES: hypothetical protein [Streptomyces]|uniref:hypothetical protein n=1 Tax=Streptomyces TaxID=1883 RepID=UPI001E655ED6|nr:hypothetical protein [Streptomyces canarius]
MATVKGTGRGGRITVQDVCAAERTTSGHQASAWPFVAVLAVLALVFGSKIIEAAKKEQVEHGLPAGLHVHSLRVTGRGIPRRLGPGRRGGAAGSRPRPGLPGGDRHAPWPHRPDPQPGHQRRRRLGRRHPPGPGIQPGPRRVRRGRPGRSAVSTLAADARAMGASLRDPGNSSLHVVRDGMSSDLEDLSSACEGSSQS